jgi:alpha-glucan,water dikinase
MHTSLKGISAETEFRPASGGQAVQELEITFAKVPLTLAFVLKDSHRGDWYKSGNDNFRIPMTEAGRERMNEDSGSSGGKRDATVVRSMSGTEILVPDGAGVAKEIMTAESHGSVTLMHRYNHAAHLLEKCPPGPAGRDHLTMIFCWLRFSQIRQLSWQRNYNTKPRELSAASERLNKLIAWRWKNSEPKEKEIYRLMLGCIGRGGSGGDGQAIRDEILHIMHRHKIPETKGNFMEEWHQKLHNNSTPDDIIICQAYLAFLNSNGNRAEFWRVIHENGLNKERLASYERAIVCEPEFYGHAKDGLIKDFQNYLRILKNVHAGADLEKCVEVCRGFLDGHMNQVPAVPCPPSTPHGHWAAQLSWAPSNCIADAFVYAPTAAGGGIARA